MLSGMVQRLTETDKVEGGSVRPMPNELLSLLAKQKDSGPFQSRSGRGRNAKQWERVGCVRFGVANFRTSGEKGLVCLGREQEPPGRVKRHCGEEMCVWGARTSQKREEVKRRGERTEESRLAD